jgi:PKD repeat protein
MTRKETTMIGQKLALAIAGAATLLGCGEKIASIGNPPPAPEFSVDQSDPNNPIFKVTSVEGFMFNWDFGNGKLSQDSLDTVYFPFADTYTVKLTASNKGGATTTAKKLMVATTDPKICANRYYRMLTGGCDAAGKTWKIDNADSALGNGGPPGKNAEGNGVSTYNDPIMYWWQSSLKSEKPSPPPGALDDDYVFGLRGFTYKNECHGDFYFNWQWANKLFGMTQAQYADTIHAYTPNGPATWTLDIDSTTVEDTIKSNGVVSAVRNRFITDSATGKRVNLILTLSNDNYLGYCSGASVYQILKMTPDTMYLRHELVETDPKNANATGTNRLEWRYLRLVAKK